VVVLTNDATFAADATAAGLVLEGPGVGGRTVTAMSVSTDRTTATLTLSSAVDTIGAVIRLTATDDHFSPGVTSFVDGIFVSVIAPPAATATATRLGVSQVIEVVLERGELLNAGVAANWTLAGVPGVSVTNVTGLDGGTQRVRLEFTGTVTDAQLNNEELRLTVADSLINATAGYANFGILFVAAGAATPTTAEAIPRPGHSNQIVVTLTGGAQWATSSTALTTASNWNIGGNDRLDIVPLQTVTRYSDTVIHLTMAHPLQAGGNYTVALNVTNAVPIGSFLAPGFANFGVLVVGYTAAPVPGEAEFTASVFEGRYTISVELANVPGNVLGTVNNVTNSRENWELGGAGAAVAGAIWTVTRVNDRLAEITLENPIPAGTVLTLTALNDNLFGTGRTAPGYVTVTVNPIVQAVATAVQTSDTLTVTLTRGYFAEGAVANTINTNVDSWNLTGGTNWLEAGIEISEDRTRATLPLGNATSLAAAAITAPFVQFAPGYSYFAAPTIVVTGPTLTARATGTAGVRGRTVVIDLDPATATQAAFAAPGTLSAGLNTEYGWQVFAATGGTAGASRTITSIARTSDSRVTLTLENAVDTELQLLVLAPGGMMTGNMSTLVSGDRVPDTNAGVLIENLSTPMGRAVVLSAVEGSNWIDVRITPPAANSAELDFTFHSTAGINVANWRLATTGATSGVDVEGLNLLRINSIELIEAGRTARLHLSGPVPWIVGFESSNDAVNLTVWFREEALAYGLTQPNNAPWEYLSGEANGNSGQTSGPAGVSFVALAPAAAPFPTTGANARPNGLSASPALSDAVFALASNHVQPIIRALVAHDDAEAADLSIEAIGSGANSTAFRNALVGLLGTVATVPDTAIPIGTTQDAIAAFEAVRNPLLAGLAGLEATHRQGIFETMGYLDVDVSAASDPVMEIVITAAQMNALRDAIIALGDRVHGNGTVWFTAP